MFEGFFKKVAHAQERFPLVLILLLVLITIFFAYYAVNLENDSSFDTLFGKDSSHYELKNLVANEFGATDQIYVLMSIDDETNDKTRVIDIRQPEVLVALDHLEKSLLDESSVESVFSISSMYLMVYGYLPQTLEESKVMFENLPAETKSLVANDFSAANMIVGINIPNKPGSMANAQIILEEKIASASIPVGIKSTLTGEPPLLNRIMNLLIGDNLKTVLFAIVAITLLLMYFFRSPILGIIGVIPVSVSLVMLAGTMVLLDIRLTMMTAAVGAMMVGIGVDYAIHMIYAYQDELKKGKLKIASIVVPSVGGALTASALTTIAGFLAMLFATGPSAKVQGTILAFGVLYAFLTAVFILPALLVVHSKLAYSDLDNVLFRVRDTDHQQKKESLMQKVLKALARLQSARPGFILILFIIITFLITPGMSLLRFDTDNDNWIPPGDSIFAAIQEVGSKFDGLESQTFLVMIDNEVKNSRDVSDLRDPLLLSRLDEISLSMPNLEFVNSVDSPVIGIKEANAGKIPQEIEHVKSLVNANPQLLQYYNDDFTIMKVSVRSDDLSAGDPVENYDDLLHEIEAVGMPDGVKMIAQGGFASDEELDGLLAGDTVKTTVIGFFFVFLVALFIYRSFVVGIMAFIPIIVAMIWTVGIMGYIDLPFTVLTSGMLAIVMGIGIDFSIHIIHNTRLALKKGLSIAESIAYSLTTTGMAISVSTATTIVGFLSLVLATLLATQRLGYTLAIAIASSFIACIVIVPATLVIQHNLSKKNPRRQRK